MSKATRDDYGNVLQLLEPAPTHKTVSVSGTSAQSAVIELPAFVELYCDTLCFVAVGTNPTATTSGIPVYAGIPRTIKVAGGSKIAAITDGGTDTLRIVEMV